MERDRVGVKKGNDNRGWSGETVRVALDGADRDIGKCAVVKGWLQETTERSIHI